jgi:hypothetical protein
LTADLAWEFDPTLRVEFDASHVAALRENEDARYTRTIAAWDAALITRNEARASLGFPPIEDLRIASLTGMGDAMKETMLDDTPAIMDVTPTRAQLEDAQKSIRRGLKERATVADALALLDDAAVLAAAEELAARAAS